MPRKSKQQLKEELKKFIIHDWDDANWPILVEFAFLCGKASAYEPSTVEELAADLSREQARPFKDIALKHLHQCEAEMDNLIENNEILPS